MRTANVCPTCAVYTNSLCVIYNGANLSNINVATSNDLQTALSNINSSVQLKSNLSTNTSLGNSDVLYPSQNAVKSYITSSLNNVMYTNTNQTITANKFFNPGTLQIVNTVNGEQAEFYYSGVNNSSDITFPVPPINQFSNYTGTVQYVENISQNLATNPTSTIQYPSVKAVNDGLSTKQNTLVSGTNIKTINGQSVLGSGNIVVGGSTTSWKDYIPSIDDNNPTLIDTQYNSLRGSNSDGYVLLPTNANIGDVIYIISRVTNLSFQVIGQWTGNDARINKLGTSIFNDSETFDTSYYNQLLKFELTDIQGGYKYWRYSVQSNYIAQEKNPFTFAEIEIIGLNIINATQLTANWNNVYGSSGGGRFALLPISPSIGDTVYVSNVDPNMDLVICSYFTHDIFISGTSTTVSNYAAGKSTNQIYTFKYVDVGKWMLSITPSYIAQEKTYKVYSALVSRSGSTFTITQLQNDFVGTTFSFTNPLNGTILITASTSTFNTNKTVFTPITLDGGGIVYAATDAGLGNSTTLYIYLTKCSDNTRLITPNFTNQLFEFKVYN